MRQEILRLIGGRITAPLLFCLLSACASGKAGREDASLGEDATPQLDSGARHDALDAAQDSATDRVLDGPAADALTDAAVDVPPQQDAQADAAQACTTDSDCNPDGSPGGRYCYSAKGVCYTPGTCASSAECPPGSECKFTVVPLGFYCTCRLLSIPPLLCRDEGVREDCLPGFGVCVAHTEQDAATQD